MVKRLIPICGFYGVAAALLTGSTPAFAQFDTSVSSRFAVKATIERGCVIGGGTSSATSVGTIDFGQVTLLSGNVDAASSRGAGSIVLRCTPGINVTISMGAGQNAAGSIAGGRYMRNAAGSGQLRYQLYPAASRATPWGDGANGGQAFSVATDGTNQEFVVYARLFAVNPMPGSGAYSDTVTVTVSY